MQMYTFEGAVYIFDVLFEACWKASTWAVSEAKAISNLKYRFRKANGIIDYRPITLSGRVMATGK